MIKNKIRKDSDTITVNRVDFIPQKIGSIKKTDEGFLQGTAPIAKIGVLTYLLQDGSLRKEFISEDTLFNHDSMNSLKLKPITNQHPKESLLNSRTVKKRKVGITGEKVKRDGDFLTTSLIIMDSDAIEDIENGTRELSPGYQVNLLMKSGEYKGEKYDAIQLNRKYNHLATCDCARGGKDLRLNLDSEIKYDGFEIDNKIDNREGNVNLNKEKKTMPKITINKIDYEAAQEVINYVETLKADSVIHLNKNKELNAKHDKLTGKYDTLKEDHKNLEESIPEIISSGVKEKVALDAICKKILDAEEVSKLDGKSNDEIKKIIIIKKYPEAKLDDKNEAYINGRFDSIVESIKEDKSIDKQRKTINQNDYTKKDNLDETEGDKAYNEMVKRDSERWKNKA